MKKILAVLISVMMLFSALSVGASAIDLTDDYITQAIAEEVIIAFNLNGGSIKGFVSEYDPDSPEHFKSTYNYSGSIYYRIPGCDEVVQKPGKQIPLPRVNPPADHAFNGWYCSATGETYPGGTLATIPSTGYTGKIIEYTADYTRTVPEEDTMAGVMDILVKVFGAIVGLLFYSNTDSPVEAGMDVMTNLLTSLLK